MHFYILSLRTAKSPFAEMKLSGKPSRIEPPTCPDCGVRLSSLVRLPPHRYQLVGGTPGDFLADGMVLAFSARFVKAYRDSGLTGLDLSERAIELAATDTQYFLGYPLCTRSLLDEAASGVVIDELRGCDRCRVMSMRRIERVVIREDTWEGQDIFKSGNLFNVDLLTQRFVDFVRENEFTNFQFIDQDAFNEDFDG